MKLFSEVIHLISYIFVITMALIFWKPEKTISAYCNNSVSTNSLSNDSTQSYRDSLKKSPSAKKELSARKDTTSLLLNTSGENNQIKIDRTSFDKNSKIIQHGIENRIIIKTKKNNCKTDSTKLNVHIKQKGKGNSIKIIQNKNAPKKH